MKSARPVHAWVGVRVVAWASGLVPRVWDSGLRASRGPWYTFVAVIELVVAHGHRVEAGVRHQLSVRLSLEQRVEARASDRVSGVQLEDIPAGVLHLAMWVQRNSNGPRESVGPTVTHKRLSQVEQDKAGATCDFVC